MSTPSLQVADADFVSDRLAVGGDLHTHDPATAAAQLRELVDAGVTHLLDVRVEWSDEQWVAEQQPQLRYLHLGIDDAGQRVPASWFEEGVGWAQEALADGGAVLVHCHMGINRGPSLGFAVLLAQGLDPVAALDAVRDARPVAWIAYADDALRWHHERQGSPANALEHDLDRLDVWRRRHDLDVERVIRRKREQGW